MAATPLPSHSVIGSRSYCRSLAYDAVNLSNLPSLPSDISKRDDQVTSIVRRMLGLNSGGEVAADSLPDLNMVYEKLEKLVSPDVYQKLDTMIKRIQLCAQSPLSFSLPTSRESNGLSVLVHLPAELQALVLKLGDFTGIREEPTLRYLIPELSRLSLPGDRHHLHQALADHISECSEGFERFTLKELCCVQPFIKRVGVRLGGWGSLKTLCHWLAEFPELTSLYIVPGTVYGWGYGPGQQSFERFQSDYLLLRNLPISVRISYLKEHLSPRQITNLSEALPYIRHIMTIDQDCGDRLLIELIHERNFSDSLTEVELRRIAPHLTYFGFSPNLTCFGLSPRMTTWQDRFRFLHLFPFPKDMYAHFYGQFPRGLTELCYHLGGPDLPLLNLLSKKQQIDWMNQLFFNPVYDMSMLNDDEVHEHIRNSAEQLVNIWRHLKSLNPTLARKLLETWWIDSSFTELGAWDERIHLQDLRDLFYDNR